MAGKKVDGGTVTIKVTDGDSLKDIQKKVKKARGEFDGLSKSTQAADRAGKGLSRQSSNQTKNFSKMQQGISGGIVPAYATLAANVFALSAAYQFLQTSMNTRNMIEGQKAFGSITGVAYGTITDSIRKATQGQLAFKEAAEAAAIGTAAGLNRDQLERLGTAATNVSIALGRDLADSFNRLVRGVTKAEPELLDELGIVLRLDPALRAYGVAIGKSVADLNQFEKSQAIANEVLGQAETKFGAIQQVMEPGAFAMGQFTSAFNDLLDILKNALGGLAQTVLPFFTENVAALASALALVAVPILRVMLPNFEAMSASAAKNVIATKGSLDILQDELAQTALASQALDSGGEKKLGADGANYTKGKLGKLGVKGLNKDKSGNLSQGQVAAYRRTWKAKSGIWKKMTKQEQIDFKLSLDKMDMAHKASAGKQNIETTKSELSKRAKYKKTEIFYKKTQLMMVTASKNAARGMNMALKAAGIIGIITMIGSAVMAVVNAFKKVDELEEARKESLKDQASVNMRLSDEVERMVQLRTREVKVLKDGEMVTKRILQYNSEMNMQTAQALSSAALGAQAKKYGDSFNEKTKFRDDIRYEDVISARGDVNKRQIKTKTTNFKGDQGDAQTGLQRSLGSMANLMSEDFKFNTAGIGEADEFVSAKDKLLEFQNIVRDGGKLNDEQVNDLQQIEAQYGSLSSRVKLAAEIQKTYDKNLSKMGGKGLFGGAMRNSIAEMEKGLVSQREMAVMKNKDGIVDQVKLDKLEKQEELVSNFKKELENVLVLDRGIKDAKHEQAMAMEAAKVTRGFETKMSELSLKNEQKRIKVLEAAKAVKIAEVAQAALGAAATEADRADAAENVRVADDKLKLSKEELRIQKLLTIEAEKQARLNKFGAEIAQAKKLTALIDKLNKATLDSINPFFSGMSKGTRGVAERKLNPKRAEQDYNRTMLSATNNYEKSMAKKDNTLVDEQFALRELQLTEQIAANTKQMAERTEAQRAVDLAAQAGGKALEGGMTTGLMKVAKGDAKASEAAKEVALGVAEAILQSMIQSLVSNLLGDLLAKLAISAALETTTQGAMASLGGVIALNTTAVQANTMGKAFGFGARDGGVFNAGKRVQGYSSGGIAEGSTSGYPALLHGKEAVIPIPSGDKIPVEVKGGTMTNSVVNVTVNSDGSSSMDAEKASALGKGIQAAVQTEIAKQQRYGGLLSGK
jgi:hypothetical protein